MDIVVTALGEFIWATSCAVVNFCLSSGLSVLAVFVSFLCAIFASAFYKYTLSRQEMSLDDTTYTPVDQDSDDIDKPITITSTAEPPMTPSLLPTETDESNNTDRFQSLSEIEICIEDDTNENEEDTNENEVDTNENEEDTNENEVDTNENEAESSGNDTEDEPTSNDIIMDTIEGSEEEIQKKQIANIYRLLNDQHLINSWTTTDFVDQLKMYGLEAYEENELDSS